MKNWVRIFVLAVGVMSFALALATKALAEEPAQAAPEVTASQKDAPPKTEEKKAPTEQSAAETQGGDLKTEFNLTIKNHVFDPAEIEAPANQKITLNISNQDNASEEFESMSLRREKMIPAKGNITLTVGPLKDGTYEFSGEFHRDTAKGRLIVK